MEPEHLAVHLFRICLAAYAAGAAATVYFDSLLQDGQSDRLFRSVRWRTGWMLGVTDLSESGNLADPRASANLNAARPLFSSA